MNATLWRLLTAMSLIAALSAGCSDSEDRAQRVAGSGEPKASASAETGDSGTRPSEVLDTFKVGDSIYVRALAVDTAGNALWVGTSTGVLEIDLGTQQARNTFTRKDGLANEYVFAVHVDRRGYKWFGTNAGGISRYRDGEWKVYFPMHGLADYWVYAFVEQHRGPLWIGTWAGANSVDPETMQFRTFKKELINEWVYGLAVDSKDRVWFGTEGGISVYDGANWRHWTHAAGLGAPNVANLPTSSNTGLGTRSRHNLSVLMEGEESYNPNYVFALLIDPQDRVWAGTWGGGAALFDGTKWTNYTTQDGLAGNIVYSIARQPDGVLWFGTNRGLTRFDGTNWVTYDRSRGLLDNDVYAIVTTANGDVWVGTKGGVCRLGARKP